MGITEYGKVVRELRKEVKASLRQMAEAIGFSPTYVSAVEVGEKGITDDLIDRAVGFFKKEGMKPLELAKLRASVDRTRKSVDVSSLDTSGRLAVATFARKWKDLDLEAREKFLKQVGASLEDDAK